MRRQQEEMMRRQQEGYKGGFPDAVRGADGQKWEGDGSGT